MYTWEGTSKKEAAVINMILSDFGQDTFVAPNNYFKLGARRREEERAKLPDRCNRPRLGPHRQLSAVSVDFPYYAGDIPTPEGEAVRAGTVDIRTLAVVSDVASASPRESSRFGRRSRAREIVYVTAVDRVTYRADIRTPQCLLYGANGVDRRVHHVLPVRKRTASVARTWTWTAVDPGQGGNARWFFWLESVLPSDSTYWNPLSGAYSLTPMLGAVVGSIIAGAVAGPLRLFGALFIAEVASDRRGN